MEAVAHSSAAVSTGGTEREHLEQICKQTGKTPEELDIELPETDEPDIPEGGEFLWVAFWDLSQCRGNNGISENPIPWREMTAYFQIYGLNLTPAEAEILRRMDRTYLSICAELTAKQAKSR